MNQASVAEHDAVMATPPIEYRGYLIKPVSFKGVPHASKGKTYSCGWNVIQDGCNAVPGAVWCPTTGGAKTLIDCLHEAGPRPPIRIFIPVSQADREESNHLTELQKAWNERFWTLVRERENEEFDTRWIIVGYPFEVSFKTEAIARALAQPGQRVVEVKIKRPTGPFSDELEFPIPD